MILGYREINDRQYALRVTDQRQFLDRREHDWIIDHDVPEIRFSIRVKNIIESAVEVAIMTAPVISSSASGQVGGQAFVPATISGCFPVLLIPWPWWAETNHRPLRRNR
jgi:hypothetical protein